MDRTPEKFPVVATIVVVGVAAVGLYFGAYFSMVQPVRYPHMALLTMGSANWKPSADAAYPAAPGPPRFWERLFAPANAIDRKLRPELWSAEDKRQPGQFVAVPVRPATEGGTVRPSFH